MHHRLFSGDKFADAGKWSPSTSAANFCEEDYAVTPFVAEFIGTISSLIYCYYAYIYAKGGIWDLQAIALALVGIFSAIFHATLKQETLFGDDLSMLGLTASFLIPVWTARVASPATRDLISGVVVTSVAAVALAYVRTADVEFHSLAFATLLALGVPRTVYLVRTARPGPESPPQPGWRAARGRGLLRAGALVAAGFALWNVDLELCDQLRALRARVGLPLAWGLEMHGWWHLLTAAGAYEYMKVVRAVAT